MSLIDEARAAHLYSRMGPCVEASGGSAANTMAGAASLGGKPAYIGRVCKDQLGEIFSHDMLALGIQFAVPPASSGPSTGRCLILVTPDAQRTMNTYLGASVLLTVDDIAPPLVARGRILYLEGYLFDPPHAQEAFRAAAALAHAAGRKVSLTLSDPFCVDRHREAFVDLVERHVDVLFANELEICSLYQVSAFDDALQEVRGHCEVAVLTRGGRGSLVIAGD